ncbi:MAG: hypothetical protein KBD24_02275 [Candidatus Pacebacteria bacterium]|nr:hypothetical protein [Candidatus Paceibacterota bacterium]
MSKDTFLLIVGALVFSVPFIGVPSAWKDSVQFVLGGVVLLVAVGCRIQRRRGNRTRGDAVHVEHDPARHEAEVTPV